MTQEIWTLLGNGQNLPSRALQLLGLQPSTGIFSLESQTFVGHFSLTLCRQKDGVPSPDAAIHKDMQFLGFPRVQDMMQKTLTCKNPLLPPFIIIYSAIKEGITNEISPMQHCGILQPFSNISSNRKFGKTENQSCWMPMSNNCFHLLLQVLLV